MTIKFILMVNKQGQTRLAQYYETLSLTEKNALEGEVIRKCLIRGESRCSFIEYQSYKIVYSRYASLYFIVAVDKQENELAIVEFVRNLVETLDSYFESVCELDIMFNIDKAHFILDEMISNGEIFECNKGNILRPIQTLDKFVSGGK